MKEKSTIINTVSILLFLFILILYKEDKIDEKLLLTAAGSIATIYFGILKHIMENDRIFKELFMSFNERYDNTFNDLINEIKLDKNRILSKHERNKVIDYFNLCAEEYMWRTRNRIPEDVWLAWKAGIIENLTIAQVRDVYLYEISTETGRTSFYGLVEELNIN